MNSHQTSAYLSALEIWQKKKSAMVYKSERNNYEANLNFKCLAPKFEEI